MSRRREAAGVPVSFDVNYRSRLWSPKEARDFLGEILPRLRYLFIGSDDAATVLRAGGLARGVLARARARWRPRPPSR